jgi:hypothetical protein
VFLFANGKFHWWLHRTFEAATCGHRLGWIGHKLADQQKKGSPINYLGYFHIPADFHTIQWMFFFVSIYWSLPNSIHSSFHGEMFFQFCWDGSFVF